MSNEHLLKNIGQPTQEQILQQYGQADGIFSQSLLNTEDKRKRKRDLDNRYSKLKSNIKS